MMEHFMLFLLTYFPSFIEENHEYKRQSQARQSAQVSQPGRPSQDMMSFWGEFSNINGSLIVVNVYRIQIRDPLPLTSAMG